MCAGDGGLLYTGHSGDGRLVITESVRSNDLEEVHAEELPAKLQCGHVCYLGSVCTYISDLRQHLRQS